MSDSRLLNRAIDCFVKEKYDFRITEDSEDSEDSEDVETLEQTTKKMLIEEIRKNICDDKIIELKERAKEEYERERKESLIATAKKLIAETIILGFLVGLLVNQCTILIDLLKSGVNNVVITSIFILILVIVIVLMILSFFLNSLSELINEKKNN